MAINKDFIVKNGLQVLGSGSANSTSTTTGALIVGGGVGIWKDTYIGGKLTVRGGIDGTVTTATNIEGGALGSVVYQTGAGVTSTLPIGSAGQVLTVDAGSIKWVDFGDMQASTATDALNVFVKDITTVSTTVYLALAEGLGDPAVSSKIDASSNLTYNPGTGVLSSGKLSLTSNANSSNPSSGALVVTGGAGVGLNLVVGGTTQLGYSSDNWFQFQGSATGNAITLSSVGADSTVGINLTAKGNGTITVTSTATSSGQSSGALVVNGGLGVGGSIYGGNIFDNGARVLHDVNVTGGSSISVSSVSTSNGVMSFTINNDGVTSLSGTTYLGVSASTGSITLTNLGVQNITSGTETTVTATGAGGTGTVSINVTSTLDNVVQRSGETTGTIWIKSVATSNTSTNGALIVDGGLGVGENVNIGGSLNVWGPTTFSGSVAFNGTATFVYSTNTFYTDNLISLHDASAGDTSAKWTYDDGKDVGVVYHYFNRTDNTGTAAALLFANDSQWFELYDRGSEIGSIFSGTNYGSLKGDKIYLESTVNATTASGTFGSASFQTLGGASVAKDLYVGGTIYSGGNQVITAANIGTFGVTSLTASNGISVSTATGAVTISNTGVLDVTGGTDITVSTATGSVTINDASTLQSVTGRGATTTNPITVNASGSSSTSTTASNALMVYGGIAGNSLFVDGSASITDTLWVNGSVVSGTVYSGGNQALTSVQPSAGNGVSITSLSTTGGVVSFTVNNTGVLSVTAGTDISVTTATGDLTISDTSTLQSVTNRGSTTTNIITINNTASSTSTIGGNALAVSGGIGAQSLYLSGDIYINGTPLYTTSTVGVSSITAGNGISINTATGDVTVTNTGVLGVIGGTDITLTTSSGVTTINDASTLQSVTGRGATTNNAVSITNSTQSTGTTSGALKVTGGVGIGGNLNIGGDLNVDGTIYMQGVGLNNITASTGTFDYIVAEGTGTGLTVTDGATIGGALGFGPAAQASSFASASTSTAAPISLDSYSASAYRTAKYVCQVVDGSDVQAEELLVFHNDTDAYIIKYGIGTSNGELGDWDATLDGGIVTLKFTPNYNPTALTVKTLRTAITA